MSAPGDLTEMVSVSRPGSSRRPMQAYFTRPDGPGPFPGVVVIHELFGLNEDIRSIARRFAQEGFAALAVDLFSTAGRYTCMARIFQGLLIRPIQNGVVDDLQAALDYLQARPELDPDRIGAIGFCMGGSLALQLACAAEGMRAASVFYGMNPRPLEAVARACPIVGSYPKKDFTANAAQRLEPALEQYHVPHDIKIYPGARHSFFNQRGPTYKADAADDAWRRTLAFFDEHLRSQ